MKIVQGILSKSLLIALVILASLAYHFRAELFPAWVSAPTTESTSESTSSEPLKTQVQTAPVLDTPPPVAAPTLSDPDLPPLITAPSAELSDAPTDIPAQPSAPAMPAAEEPVSSEPDPISNPVYAPDSSSTVTTEPAEESVTTNTPSNTVASDQSNVTLDAARAAFWAKDFSQAEQIYQQLADADPSFAEPLGELGNLYYMQGRWNDAAAAYAGAVQRLAQRGEIPHARHMLMILDGLDPARAQAIWESGVLSGG